MAVETFDIQKLVQESGIPRRTVYFYVQQGILPPPEGAGLAAYYTREHLVRLQLIPALRARGLRLDEIREKLQGMSVEELERLKREVELTPTPRPLPVIPPAAAPRVAEPPEWAPPEWTPPGWTPKVGTQGRALMQYSLPGGVMLLVPAAQTPDGQRLVQRLLEAAAAIYNTPGLAGRENGKVSTDFETGQEE